MSAIGWVTSLEEGTPPRVTRVCRAGGTSKRCTSHHLGSLASWASNATYRTWWGPLVAAGLSATSSSPWLAVSEEEEQEEQEITVTPATEKGSGT